MAMRYFVLQKALWLDFLATVDYVKLFGQCGVYCVFFCYEGGGCFGMNLMPEFFLCLSVGAGGEGACDSKGKV